MVDNRSTFTRVNEDEPIEMESSNGVLAETFPTFLTSPLFQSCFLIVHNNDDLSRYFSNLFAVLYSTSQLQFYPFRACFCDPLSATSSNVPVVSFVSATYRSGQHWQCCS